MKNATNKVSRCLGIMVVIAILLAAQFGAPASRSAAAAPTTPTSTGAGLLDPGYGLGGKLLPPNMSGDWRLAVQPDGGIVLARLEGTQFVVSRLDSSGQADLSFAGTGTQRVNPEMPDDWLDPGTPQVTLAGLATQADGKIVVLGAAHDELWTTSVHHEYGNLVLWRDNPDGSVDPSFGVQFARLAEVHAGASVLGVQPNGKILVVGRAFAHDCTGGPIGTCADAVETFAMARFVDGGSHDSSFPDIMDPDLGGTQLLAGQYDDKVLLMRDNKIRRYNSNAGNQLDPSFGDAGIIDPAVPIVAMISLPNGKLLTAGSDGDFVIARFMPDGSRDSSFGLAGVARAHFDGAASFTTLALQPDGEIVAVGARNGDFAIARFMPDGALDQGFGVGGLATTNFGGNDRATAVNVTPDGKIVVAGSSDGRLAAARYLGDNCGAEFTDVAADAYYRQPVQYLYCHSIISGYADGSFGPANPTTRAQLAKIVVLAQGWPLVNPATPTFADVPAASPFYRFVETAARARLINGYADGTFRPGANITRAQLSKIIVLARGWPLLTPLQPSFRDVDAANPFYSFIETAYANRVLSGYELADGGREFRWGASATRGQVAKIVYNAIGVVAPTQEKQKGK